jgi:hypothetical protein
MPSNKRLVRKSKLLIDYNGIQHQLSKTKAEEHEPNKIPLLNDSTEVKLNNFEYFGFRKLFCVDLMLFTAKPKW